MRGILLYRLLQLLNTITTTLEKFMFSSNPLCLHPNSEFTLPDALAQLKKILCNTILSCFNYGELIIWKSGKISWILHFAVNGKVFPMCCALIFRQLIAELTRCSDKILFIALKPVFIYLCLNRNILETFLGPSLSSSTQHLSPCSWSFPKQYIFSVVLLDYYDQPHFFCNYFIKSTTKAE